VVLERMGFAGRLVAHGMRALASTSLNEQGFDHDVIETALAHADKYAANGNMSLANAKQHLRVIS
jgi:hypothetical protein